MKIIFSGGGTLGPVTPLLALIEHARSSGSADEFLWIGTERGVEIPLLKKYGVTTVTIPCGKFRRYFDVRNVSDLWRTVRGVQQARAIIKKFAPEVCVTAGGFVSVPVHIAAWLCGVPTIVHQQDVVIGLANRIMARWARIITASIPSHKDFFGAARTHVIGNPVRPSILAGSRERAQELFHLDPERATVFCFGGGTGAESLNVAVQQMAQESNGLFQIIHLTGMERERSTLQAPFYHPYPFFTTEMAHAYAVADVVVARAGFNTIAESAAWGKPMVLVPIDHGHQVMNAAFAGGHGAAIVLKNSSLNSAEMFEAIRELLADQTRYTACADAAHQLLPPQATERLWQEICKIIA